MCEGEEEEEEEVSLEVSATGKESPVGSVECGSLAESPELGICLSPEARRAKTCRKQQRLDMAGRDDESRVE